MSKLPKVTIENDRQKPVTLWLEPWGEDYTLVHKEKIEIRPSNPDEGFHYHLVYGDKRIWVYVEEGEYPEVLSNGTEIYCGHNRELNEVGIPILTREEELERAEAYLKELRDMKK